MFFCILEVFLDSFCYHLIRTSNCDSVYCMPCRCPKQVWKYFNRQNGATMSPQLICNFFLFLYISYKKILLAVFLTLILLMSRESLED
jgi:hypothetical protein